MAPRKKSERIPPASKLPDPIDASVGGAVRRIRKTRKASQKELAEHLGLSVQQIQKYEAGANRIGASTLFRIAEFLGVNTDSLYAGVGGAAVQARGSSTSLWRRLPKLRVIAVAAPLLSEIRDAELIEVVSEYQQITDPALRQTVRQLMKRLSDPQQT